MSESLFFLNARVMLKYFKNKVYIKEKKYDSKLCLSSYEKYLTAKKSGLKIKKIFI